MVVDDKEIIAVLVPGSDKRPHFTGKAFIRVEGESREASEASLAELIAMRSSKMREILNWKEKLITFQRMNVEHVMNAVGPVASTHALWVKACNGFYITLSETNSPDDRCSYPLERIMISFDHERDRLALELRPS